MSDWRIYILDEFLEINPKVALERDSEYSFVEMKDLNPSLKYVLPSSKRELKGGMRFQNGDTLFARITPCLENGKISQLKCLDNGVGFGSTEFLVFIGKDDLSDSDFVYYLSRTDYFRNNAIQLMTGTSGRQRVKTQGLKELEISAPDLPTQRQIAIMLSSLDDKIELNLQMNQTLEKMAQAIFKEWFVDFNFPGFDGELVDGLPKGWRMGSILEISKLLSGGTPKTKIDNYWNGSIKWIAAKDISSNNRKFIFETEKTITEEGIRNSAAKLLPKNTTIISARGTVGNICILSKEMAISQSNYGLKSDNNFDYFTFLMAINMISMMKSYSYGTVFDTITTKTFNEMEIIIPPDNVIEEFEASVSFLFSRIKSSIKENMVLSQTRDTLLPKLMSGQIEIA